MIIHVDDDWADEILVANLAESYAALKEMMKRPESWHEDDVAAWKELIPAMELVGGWYSTDFKAAVKAAKRKAK
jgi:hypothetical protein